MFKFGNRACYDPESLYLQCLEDEIPTGHWYGKVNTFRVKAGEKPSSGKLLLMQSQLEELDDTKSYSLKIEDTYGNAHEFRNLFIVGSVCVLPGHEDAANNVYLVEVADARCRLAMLPVDKGYNVRTGDGISLTGATQNAGSPWTWAEMIEDLWTMAGLGTWPGTLPVTPHGRPENIGCYGDYALSCLVRLLNRVGCELQPLGDGFFKIVKQGDTTETRWPKSRRTYDGYPRRGDAAQKPEKVRVRFVRMPQPTDGSSPYYTVDVATSVTPGVFAGSVVQVDDDLPALGTSTPTNDSDLTARATERAADWERLYTIYEKPDVRVFHEYVRGSGGSVGVRYGEVVYEDRGSANATEALVLPGRLNIKPYLNDNAAGTLLLRDSKNPFPLCKTVLYGVTTYSRVVERLDQSLVCVEIPDCCPDRFYCVPNRETVAAVGACCPTSTPLANRFTATSVMRVRFADRTGYALNTMGGLPKGIFLYSDDGQTWTGGAQFYMGNTSFTGAVVVTCVSGVLKVTWGISNFTGTTPVNIPCEFNTELDLGTFDVQLKLWKECAPFVDAPPASVRIYISAALDVNDEPESPLKVEAGWIPPWLRNGGSFLTLVEAEQCCPNFYLETTPCWEAAGIPDPLNPPDYLPNDVPQTGYIPMVFKLPKRINLYFHSGTGTLAGANGVATWETEANTTPGWTVLTGGDVAYFASGVGFNSQACLDSPNSFTVPGTSVQLKCAILMFVCFDGRNSAFAPNPMTNFFSRIAVAMKMYSPNEIYHHSNTVAQGGSFGPDATPYEGSSALRLKPGADLKKYTIVVSGGAFYPGGTPIPGTCLVDFYL